MKLLKRLIVDSSTAPVYGRWALAIESAILWRQVKRN